jgi:RNA polymerase-binding transcription factor DksA
VSTESQFLPDEERTPDISDQATNREMEANKRALADVRRRCKRDQEPGPDGQYPDPDCVLCGNEIGLGRLQAAIRNSLCIECARVQERMSR